MKIGPTQTIAETFFPDVEIDVSDRKGNKLSIRDKVRIYGCEAEFGYVGYNEGKAFVYFEVDGTSVRWDIDEGVRQSIELLSE